MNNLTAEQMRTFREIRLGVAKDMLSNLKLTAKRSGCSTDNLLKLRCELVKRIKHFEMLISLNVPFSDKEEQLYKETEVPDEKETY